MVLYSGHRQDVVALLWRDRERYEAVAVAQWTSVATRVFAGIVAARWHTEVMGTPKMN